MDFGDGGGIPLPLQLISFEATKHNADAVLTWQTVNEQDMSHFELERSAGNGKWTTINNQQASNKHASDYIYIDKNIGLLCPNHCSIYTPLKTPICT